MSPRLIKSKSSFLSVLDDYVVITIGVLFYTFAWADMLIPNGIASGGLTGACTILNFATGIPVYLSYIVINGLLILLGTLILGKGFGFKTLYAIGLSTLGLDFLAGMEFLHVFFDNKLLLVIVAAIIESIGITCILARGGSTGGTDIVALIVNKFWPVSLGKVFLAVDVVIIASILLIPGKTVEDNGHRRLSVRNGRPVHLPLQFSDAAVNANGFMEFREGSRACGQEQDGAQESIQKSHGGVFLRKNRKNASFRHDFVFCRLTKGLRFYVYLLCEGPSDTHKNVIDLVVLRQIGSFSVK